MRYIGTIKNKYPEGSSVYSITNPTMELVIRRYVDTIYYCRIKELPDHKELVYFERELMKRV
ncbi:MAG TPA: hypothetical protein VK177_21020 [Flavobacteriales bacterium]|nr:hypothetical protein [Flavobacteriales bacterium]